MPDDSAWNEMLVEKKVTYHIEFDGRLCSSLRTSRPESTSRRVRGTSHRRPLSACSKWCGNDVVPFAPLRLRFMSTRPSPEGSGCNAMLRTVLVCWRRCARR